jgi:ABC-type nitrate/sulfonate/bicarbonate transport system ATPase subunit
MRAQVDLTAWRGEFVSFIGPSGWGKTTPIRVIADLHEQVSELRLLASNELSGPTRKATGHHYRQASFKGAMPSSRRLMSNVVSAGSASWGVS